MTQQVEIGFFDASRRIAGVDEVGRGPLAGPVVAAAVILDSGKPIDGLKDSKDLSELRRNRFDEVIRRDALAWALGTCTPQEIDELNILHASMLAMKRAVEALETVPDHVQVDGNRCPELSVSVEAIIGGDASVACISAASIIAKVERDRQMLEWHAQFPEYGFDRHKGYPTKQHMAALQQHGVLEIHRRSFAPVRKCLAGAQA